MKTSPGPLTALLMLSSALACSAAPDAPDYVLPQPDEGAGGAGGTLLGDDADDDVPDPSGFSWVIDGRLAGMARPGSRQDLQEDLADLQRLGVRVLVSLTEEPPPPADVASHGMALVHVPVRDFTPPSLDQLESIMARLDESLAASRPVTVHCGAGLGRTGTVLAVAFVHLRGMEPDAAIAEIRRLRPGSIETAEQERAVHDYADHHPPSTGGATPTREF